MIPPKGEWSKFKNYDDKKRHYELWDLPICKTLFYDGHYTSSPIYCKVVGYQTDIWAIVDINGNFHRIYGNYLNDVQPKREEYDGMPEEYVVFDTEATYRVAHYAEIIEIAAIRYASGKEVDRFETLVKPKRRIPKDATKINGITNADVEDAPMWEDVQDKFFEFIGDLPLVGHNVLRYDIELILHHTKRWFDNPYIDTLQRAKKAFPEIKCYKLEYLKELLGLSSGISHRAMSDVETTNALLWACENPEKYRERLAKKLSCVQLGYLKDCGLSVPDMY